MSKQVFLKGVLAAVGAVFFAGCATEGRAPEQSARASFSETGVAQPLAPSAPAAEVVTTNAAQPQVQVANKEAEKVAADAAPAGTLPSVVKKLNKNKNTLYWRDNNSYSFYVGSVVRAEFKPGSGLTVTPDNEEAGYECHYQADGKLDAAAGADPAKTAALQDQCKTLMFTLEEQLGD